MALAASRRNSATFDETFMIAAGTRALATGNLSMAWDQPPAMFYVYGAAVYAYGASRSGGVRLPPEQETVMIPREFASELPRNLDLTRPQPRWGPYSRYEYAREFFNHARNDPEGIAFAARSVAVVLTAVLAGVIALFAWRRAGPLAAVPSVACFAFLPDVLAHSAIAWNDLPLALTFLVGLWTYDRALRDPTPIRFLAVGAVTALALSVKFNALALGPAAFILALFEGMARGWDKNWMRRVALLTLIAAAVAWLGLVAVYRGDWLLAELREGVANQLTHAGSGHGVPSYLLGQFSDSPMWYFFPVALVLKTPVAFHVLGVLAFIGYLRDWRWSRDLLRSPLRLLPVGIAAYFVILLASNLSIGVRYALPLWPLLAVLIGIGLARLWTAHGRRARLAIASVGIAHVASTLMYYPWFLSYLTEYLPDRREAGYRVMVDSNLDWGQGLLALRDLMRSEGIDRVQLSYFGLVLPDSYGIKYAPLESWIPLPPSLETGAPPDWLVVSATHLRGQYTRADPFASFRERKPDWVLANTLYVFRLNAESP